MKIQLKSYLQFKFHATGVIFTMVTMFPHFPPKCGACVKTNVSLDSTICHVTSKRGFVPSVGTSICQSVGPGSSSQKMETRTFYHMHHIKAENVGT